ncbi:MAG: hypothetical protein MJ208_00615 [Bacilli bacterium]|nr:hypothetical protein [Bacilli bacterium]
MFKKKEKEKIKPEDDGASFSVNKGLLIFCLSLLVIIIVLTIVLSTVLK